MNLNAGRFSGGARRAQTAYAHCKRAKALICASHFATRPTLHRFSTGTIRLGASPHRRASVLHTVVKTAAAAKACEVEESPATEKLESFLTWLLANGVQGIGRENSKVALFASEDGERGLVCEEPIAPGEVVLAVPLRLALTDHPGDEESNALLYEGAPWSVRLACKVLRHKAAGEQSAWSPYIRVLPRHVPAPLEVFGWGDIAGLRYPAAEEALHAADWMRADAFGAASEAARGGLGEEEFRWALSVVHSRTFASAAPGGGVGVRMLVPLVDLLNHGGDTVQPGTRGLAGPAAASDNVRWDLVPPGRSGGGGWTMHVSATAPIQPGQELLLSYGERPNDDFFLHYGFVPRANAHDDAVLWADLEAALEWHYERFGAQQLSAEEAEPLYRAALEAGLAEQREERRRRGTARGGGSVAEEPPPPQEQGQEGVEAARAGDGEGEDGPELPAEVLRQLNQIKVVAGGQVTAAVVTAFAAVCGGDAAAAERAVACRCAELLTHMAAPRAGSAASDFDEEGGEQGAEGSAQETSAGGGAGGAGGGGLLVDLAALLADADPRVLATGAPGHWEPEAGSDADYWADQLRRYHQALVPNFAKLLPEAAAAAAAAATTPPPAPATKPTHIPAASSGAGNKAKYGLPPPAQTPTLPPAPAARDAAAATLSLSTLVRALLPASEDPTAAGAVSSSPFRLSGAQRLARSFRAYKQMVLWEALLRCGLGAEELGRSVRQP